MIDDASPRFQNVKEHSCMHIYTVCVETYSATVEADGATGVAGNTNFSIRFPQPRKILEYSSVLVSVESTGIQSMYQSIATIYVYI